MVATHVAPRRSLRSTASRPAVPAPAIYRTDIWHARTQQAPHAFTYRQDYWLVDVDALPAISARRPIFRATDHLGAASASIRANVEHWLGLHGIDLAGGPIMMLTTPRTAGYVFNPLTVYWCCSAGGPLRCVVAEVHNTYGERHCYLLRPDESGRALVDKAFYVSPFQSMGGEYLLRVSPPGDELHVTITLRQGETTPFTASMRGRRIPLTRSSMLRSLLRRPLGSYRVGALIRYEGIKLALRGVPIHKRPAHAPQEGVQ
ncbi:MAG: DUF1365 domain-containing protein [Mycobacteriales bacterium]